MAWADMLSRISSTVTRYGDLAKQIRTSMPNMERLARQGLTLRPQKAQRLPEFMSGAKYAPERRDMARNIYGDVIPGDFGTPAPRRRRRGITARDLASFRRVANLIRKYAAPVRHFRKHPNRSGR